MTDYVRPPGQPWPLKNLPDTSTPCGADFLMGLDEIAADLAAAGGRVPALEEAADDADGRLDALEANPIVTADRGSAQVGAVLAVTQVSPLGFGLLDVTQAQRYLNASAQAATRRLLMKLKREVSDATVLIVGDSTGNQSTEWPYLAFAALAARFPTWTVRMAFWNETSDTAYQTPTVIQTGTGARTLTIWNCSIAGQIPAHILGARYAAAVGATSPDLVMLNHGHNMGDPGTTATQHALQRASYLQFTEQVAASFPLAGQVLIAQNPSLISGRGTWQAHRANILEQVCALRGYGFIDAHQAFQDFAAAGGSLATLYADQTHPNDQGSALWASVVDAAFHPDTNASAPPVGISPLVQSARNFLGTAYDFSDWSSTNPTGWTPTNATLTKETTLRETGAQACRIAVVADGAAQIEWSVNTNTVGIRGLCSGQFLTVAARLYAPAAHLAVARIQLLDNTGGAQAASNDLSAEIRDGWVWLFTTKQMVTPATDVTVRVIARTTGNAATDLIVDRVYLVPGVLPRCG